VFCLHGSNPTMINCTITGNAASDGGGVDCLRSNPTLTNCTISGNDATHWDGGGIGCSGSSPTLTNCKITDNTADDDGGGVDCYESSPTLTNCTITGNTASHGGGVACREDSNPTLTNCILWDDSPQEIYVYSGSPIVTYCDVQGGWEGEGNIDADPLFIDPPNDDFHLQPGSPCIDAADNTAVPEGITTDLDGNPRFVNDPCTEDTGFGGPPVVDMGVYEFQPPCPSDFDCDGDVDTADLLHLLGAWGTPDGDIDGDGDTDTADLLALLANWGPCP